MLKKDQNYITIVKKDLLKYQKIFFDFNTECSNEIWKNIVPINKIWHLINTFVQTPVQQVSL